MFRLISKLIHFVENKKNFVIIIISKHTSVIIQHSVIFSYMIYPGYDNNAVFIFYCKGILTYKKSISNWYIDDGVSYHKKRWFCLIIVIYVEPSKLIGPSRLCFMTNQNITFFRYVKASQILSLSLAVSFSQD